MSDKEQMARSFGAAAGTYEAGRPDYPVEAVTWMLEPAGGTPSLRVVDVGAGTGKLTRIVRELAAEVVAVDPDPQMLAELHGLLPDVPTFAGTAEALPAPDASADAVLLGQAWHWVDAAAGSAEVARVLRPGGVLGLIWNIREESEPWVQRLTAIMHGSHAEEMLAEGPPAVGAPFGEIEERRWTWTRSMTRADLFAMARSRSYIITAEPDDRARIEAGLAELCDEIGAVGEARVDLPYVTRAYRAVRP